MENDPDTTEAEAIIRKLMKAVRKGHSGSHSPSPVSATPSFLAFVPVNRKCPTEAQLLEWLVLSRWVGLLREAVWLC